MSNRIQNGLQERKIFQSKEENKQQNNSEQEYLNKISSPQYRHVMKQVQGKKKYYYSLQPGSSFISKMQKVGGTSNKNQVTVTMKTGSTYTGEVNERNERHGYGVYQVIYGGYYEGMWKNGFKEGKGTFYYKKGLIHYEGDWQCGEPHGQGRVFNQQNQLVYEGAWKNGKSTENIYWLDYKNK
ncbi:MORN motif protein (macronuclear) [Tetrahymena thermophila SB210]|uniref:MORN motif protein n=1 Tax=Tetrahymena thermophila (strain SB210) TaxID=312017 RepID=Q23J78_TETTS|nr:MORN motif protein [Tetrahymena thermophila SB210]EAR96626.2 MORN motif protein [Tetrahymena thermophila SB210]|eukprot:XP_001016871.2 MORN motif protein [Tetrahymena thermophila SB210]